MADGRPPTDMIQRAIEANVRFYEALGRITRDYWQAVFAMLRDTPSILSSLATAATPAAQRTEGKAPSSAATLVLEGAVGAEPSAVFMVNNHLKKTVAAPVTTSSFANASGRVIRPMVRLAPSVVTLEPGAQALVQISASITDELEPEVAYRGEVSVPGLSDHRIPVLIRRGPVAAQGPERSVVGRMVPNEESSSEALRRRRSRPRRGKKG